MMRNFFFLALFLSVAEAQAGDPVFFMVNMNYSSNELAGVKAAAAKKGIKPENVIVVPPENMNAKVEKMFAAKQELIKMASQWRPDWNPAQVKALVSDCARRGLACNQEPDFTQMLGPEIESFHKLSNAVWESERKLGSIDRQVREKMDELRAQGKTVDTVVFSGHSDGSNLSGETTNRLSASTITHLNNDYPELFKDPNHVLLLGCYNMTGKNLDRWRGDLFSNATLIGGFGKRAPSRYREASRNYIEKVLAKADEIDRAAAKGARIDKTYIIKAFRSLSAVTNTQSVIDYCTAIVEGQPGASVQTCAEQWITFMGQYSTIKKEYLDLRNPTKDPPFEEDGNDLRDFYSKAQETCPANQNPDFDSAKQRKREKLRTEVKETVLRQIYWWNVQKNFGTYYSRDIAELRKLQASLGLKNRVPDLVGTLGRVEFVKRYNAVRAEISARKNNIDAQIIALAGGGTDADRDRLYQEEERLLAAEQKFTIYDPLFFLLGENSVTGKANSSVDSVLARGGIPFHWHESDAVIQPRGKK